MKIRARNWPVRLQSDGVGLCIQLLQLPQAMGFSSGEGGPCIRTSFLRIYLRHLLGTCEYAGSYEGGC